MPPRYVVIHKERGETPLEAVEKWRLVNPGLSSLPASYAGRLDPMASGKLLILLGDECKKQETYTGLDKEYEIEVVLDLGTDTGDALGLPAYANTETLPTKDLVREVLHSTLGTHAVPFPAFSSKTVNGKPLFLYSLEGTLDTIQIPEHDETIYNIKLLKEERLSNASLASRIADALKSVPRSDEPSKVLGADFRQDVIRAGWRVLLEHIPERKFMLLRLRVSCASGTYMRTLAERVGKELGTRGFALSINRTKIGRYRKLGPLRFWNPSY